MPSPFGDARLGEPPSAPPGPPFLWRSPFLWWSPFCGGPHGADGWGRGTDALQEGAKESQDAAPQDKEGCGKALQGGEGVGGQKPTPLWHCPHGPGQGTDASPWENTFREGWSWGPLRIFSLREGLSRLRSSFFGCVWGGVTEAGSWLCASSPLPTRRRSHLQRRRNRKWRQPRRGGWGLPVLPAQPWPTPAPARG